MSASDPERVAARLADLEVRSGSYDERIRLAMLIADARRLLARPPSESPANLAVLCGQLEATLKMLADSAEIVAQARFA
jgi:hypothetical protein